MPGFLDGRSAATVEWFCATRHVLRHGRRPRHWFPGWPVSSHCRMVLCNPSCPSARPEAPARASTSRSTVPQCSCRSRRCRHDAHHCGAPCCRCAKRPGDRSVADPAVAEALDRITKIAIHHELDATPEFSKRIGIKIQV